MHSEHLHESASEYLQYLTVQDSWGADSTTKCCAVCQDNRSTACCKASVMGCSLLFKAWSLAQEFDLHPKPDQCCQVLQVLWLLIEVYAECSEHLPESPSEAPAVLDNTVQLGCSNLLGACAYYHGR